MFLSLFGESHTISMRGEGSFNWLSVNLKHVQFVYRLKRGLIPQTVHRLSSLFDCRASLFSKASHLLFWLKWRARRFLWTKKNIQYLCKSNKSNRRHGLMCFEMTWRQTWRHWYLGVEISVSAWSTGPFNLWISRGKSKPWERIPKYFSLLSGFQRAI